MKFELDLSRQFKGKTVVGAIVLTYLAIMGVSLLLMLHALYFAAVAWSVRLMMSAL